MPLLPSSTSTIVQEDAHTRERERERARKRKRESKRERQPYRELDVVLKVLHEAGDVGGHALHLEHEVDHRLDKGRLPIEPERSNHVGQEFIRLSVDALELGLGLRQVLHSAQPLQQPLLHRRRRCPR
jgi:hypothetical protein